jgi:hypothetical protein
LGSVVVLVCRFPLGAEAHGLSGEGDLEGTVGLPVGIRGCCGPLGYDWFVAGTGNEEDPGCHDRNEVTLEDFETDLTNDPAVALPGVAE